MLSIKTGIGNSFIGIGAFSCAASQERRQRAEGERRDPHTELGPKLDMHEAAKFTQFSENIFISPFPPIVSFSFRFTLMRSVAFSSYCARLPSRAALTGCKSLRGRGSERHLQMLLGSRRSSSFRRNVGHMLATASQENNRAWASQVGQVAENDSHKRKLQVVLVSPQIPGNTGCIARTCAATGVGLHLIEPLGFQIDDTKLKRAGLDYWPYVVVKVHSSWTDFFAYFQQQEGEKRLLAFTKKGSQFHTEVKYKAGDWLLFGSETDGLAPAVLDECTDGMHAGGTVRLPMNETYVRSLNLSVSAGIGVYEALRQLDALHSYSSLGITWKHPGDEGILTSMDKSECNNGFP